MFIGLWHIAEKTGQVLHSNLKYVTDYPYTVSFVIRRRMMIDGFYELAKDQRPPKSLYDKPNALKEWFERIFDSKGSKQTEFEFGANDDEIEE